MTETLQNWAANFEFSAANIHRPTNVDEVQHLVRKSQKVKALGTRHSFNQGANTEGELISTQHLDRVVAIDHDRMTVTIQGGISYGQLSKHLAVEDVALHNLASLPHISVAGACATATHGSGVKNGNLATAVVELEIVRADGELVRLGHNDPDFAGAVVNIGALGIVTGLTLRIQPSFQVCQFVYQNLALSELESHFAEIASSAYSVSFFTTWQSEIIDQVWQKHVGLVGDAPETLHGATLSHVKLHPLPGHSAENCTEQLGIPGPWNERLAHFRMDFTPSSGEELQSEFMIPREKTFQALQAIAAIRDQIAPILHVSEIRTVAADSLWLSPAYGKDVTCIHFTWKKNWPAVKALLPTIEETLRPFGAMPHWGKLFLMGADRIAEVFPKMKDFKGLVSKYDPGSKFRNAYLDQVLG